MDNIVIRPGVRTDLAAMTEIYNHYVVHTSTTFDLHPFSVAERQEWFDTFNHARHPIFVAAVGDHIQAPLLGYAYAAMFRKKPAYDNTVETTIYLAPGNEGKGLGSRLYGHLLDHLDAAAVHRQIAVITLPNEASTALHLRHGFKTIGTLSEVGYKFDQHWDTLWLERKRHDHSS